MDILHISNYDKFIEPYINFIEQNFNSMDHQFNIIVGNNENIKVKNGENITKISKDLRGLISIVKTMNKSNKIFVHGLFNPKIVLLLFIGSMSNILRLVV